MPLLTVTQVDKHYKSYASPYDRLKEIILRKSYHQSFHTLKSLSFAVNAGESLAILGKNGAGKSTLLKIILGVSLPDAGQVQLNGKVTGLLELGSGFDHEQTGLNNIKTNGLLIGMSAEEIEQKQQAIIEFSELGRYIHEQIKTYSSGMLMRLAFSIAIHAEPDCFIVDEALAVGDASFQQKCYKKIREFRQRGGALLFVSHDLNAIQMMCDRALVLNQGHIEFDGNTADAINHYNRILSQDSQLFVEPEQTQQIFGNGKAKITHVSLHRSRDQATLFKAGDPVTLRLTAQAEQPLDDIVIGFLIKDRFGQNIYGTNTHHLRHPVPLGTTAQTIAFNFNLSLAPGKYTLTLALHADHHHLDECYYWHDNALEFEIAGYHTPLFTGITYLSTEITA